MKSKAAPTATREGPAIFPTSRTDRFTVAPYDRMAEIAIDRGVDLLDGSVVNPLPKF